MIHLAIFLSSVLASAPLHAETAMKEHVKNLVSLSGEAQSAAHDAIMQSTGAAVPELVAALADTDGTLRGRALRYMSQIMRLGLIQDPSAYPAVRKAAMSEPELPARHEAIALLCQFNDNDVKPTLEKILEADTQRLNRAAALRHLSFKYGKAALPTIKKYLNDKEPLLQAEAAKELGRYGDDSGYKLAKRLLVNPDFRVRSSAAAALGILKKVESKALLDGVANDPKEMQNVRFAAMRSIKQIEYGLLPPVERMPFLTRSLKDPSWPVRRWAADELLRCNDAEARSVFQEAAADSKHPGVEEARQATIRIKLAEGVNLLEIKW